jgi:hypothetical protein
VHKPLKDPSDYAHQHLDDYVYTFWAAHSREALVSGYAAVADAVKRWLGSYDGCLLILDNANDLTMADKIHPAGKERSRHIDDPGVGRGRDFSARRHS